MKKCSEYLLQGLEKLRKCARLLLKYFRLFFVTLWKKPAFLLALVTAIILMQQNGILLRELTLLEQELKMEQKPIVNIVLGHYDETIVYDGALHSTRTIMNIGKLPAYNINLRWSTRISREYPFEHFEKGMQDDSLYINILFPGTPWLDDQRLSFEANVESLSVKEIAYEMFSTEMVFYVHYWLAYHDIAGRQYVLQETISLHGSSDSTLSWGQYFARNLEFEKD